MTIKDRMNFQIAGLAILTCLVGFGGCAGDKAEIEEAAYLVGKGGAENALEAISILESHLSTATGDEAFEVYRLYSGAKMQAAGFDGLKIISTLVYQTSDDAVKNVRPAITLGSTSSVHLSDAITNLNSFVASTTYTTSTNTRAKNGIEFQRGLANFFEALRSAFTNSGLDVASGTITSAQCQAKFNGQVSIVSNINSNLATANTSFTSSQLDSGNPLVKLVKNFRDNVPNKDLGSLTAADIVTICNYLAQQSAN